MSRSPLRRILSDRRGEGFVWEGPPAETAAQARDAIADAVSDALGGEYGDFDWICDLPIKETP